jgi:cell division control protein 6
MMIDYFDELLNKPTLFIDESKLDINYVPEKLPHREKEIYLLSQLFLTLISNPNTTSRKILITGKTGVGKTVTVKSFGKMLIDASIKRHLKIKYIHINCRKERTSYKVLIKIVRALNNSFPKRGYSPQDLLEIIMEHLNNKEQHLLITLDELSYLINNGEDIIYSFTRLNDDSINSYQRISIIGIVRDITCLSNLDASTMSTLQRNIIEFKNYSREEVFDILKYRASISLINNVVSDDIMDMITELVYQNGDIRYGLNLIWKASKIAESRNLRHLNPECVRLGNQDLVPFSTQNLLNYLNKPKLIFLISIIKALKQTDKSPIPISNILEYYKVTCENLEVKQRSYSQLWNYLQEFKRDNLILINVKSEAIKGRMSLIEIPDVSLVKFERIIVDLLKSKGIRI